MKEIIVLSTIILLSSCGNGKKNKLSEEKLPEEKNTGISKKSIEPDTLQYCLTSSGVGLGTYDPVTYHKNYEPMQGDEAISSEHEGVIYYFINKENQAQFEKNPEKYLPAYGGWCSMTLVMGRATTPDYLNYTIANGQLYLFERTLSVNGKELWLINPDKNKEIAKDHYSQYRNTGEINSD